MTKVIVPHKLIAKLNHDGSVRSALLQYKLNVDGKVENRFYTMTVSAAIKFADFNKVLGDAKVHVEKSENIK